MRLLALAASILFVALSACERGSTPPAGQAPAGGPGQVTLSRTRDMPDWLLIARTRDGGFVHFNQRTIVRHADGTADVWVQIRHGRAQLEGEKGATMEQTIRYQLERLHYRFDCAGRRFTIIQRQFLNDENTVAAQVDMEPIFRAVPDTGPAKIAMPVACRGR